MCLWFGRIQSSLNNILEDLELIVIMQVYKAGCIKNYLSHPSCTILKQQFVIAFFFPFIFKEEEVGRFIKVNVSLKTIIYSVCVCVCVFDSGFGLRKLNMLCHLGQVLNFLEISLNVKILNWSFYKNNNQWVNECFRISLPIKGNFIDRQNQWSGQT